MTKASSPLHGAIIGARAQPRRVSRMRRVGIAVVVLCGALAAFVVWLGYFATPQLRVWPARGAPRGVAIVYLSGDMGFRLGLGPDLAQRFADRGVTVVGVDALAFFARARTPSQVAAILAQAERAALTHAPRVVMVGQSYGADMLHVGLAALPAPLRARVTRVVLIVPETTVEYRASPSGVFGWNNPPADAMPTARLLGREPTLCVHGAEETNSLCPLLRLPGIVDAPLPGGHPMHRDFDAVWRRVGRFVLS